MKPELGGKELFIFSLIQKNLAAEEPHAPETQPLNDRLVYLIIALASVAALILGFCRGAARFLF